MDLAWAPAYQIRLCLTLLVQNLQGPWMEAEVEVGAWCQALHSFLDARQPSLQACRPKLFPRGHVGSAVVPDGCLALWSGCRAGAEVGQACWRLSQVHGPTQSCIQGESPLRVRTGAPLHGVLPAPWLLLTRCNGRSLLGSPPGGERVHSLAEPTGSLHVEWARASSQRPVGFPGCRADLPVCSQASIYPD